ncbi:type VII secretion integral membrane protein EccD [Nocardia huaxiensis]|uniref:type VII secretion integral membrane protein EccD n=1 Tax=Nocardia huaxiensis TaxID=2755382 RepID=UPI001E490D1C|nr:type VII secretion integral membrane protein EccD [Nocardia huaxiensis]UFS95435.1 type VII secretion integral membrane protein EccD [Nocardia huaxiensis]
MTESLSGGARVAEVELCRVSVIGGNTQVDVGLPATVPIGAFIGDLVALIASRNPDPVDAEDGSAALKSEHWTLARLGRDALPPGRTLAEAEVYDGELLVLRAVGAKEAPALFDDVIDAVARLTANDFRGWSPVAAKWSGLIVAVTATILALLLFAERRGSDGGLGTGFLCLGVAVGAGVAAAIAARKYLDTVTGVGLSVCALLLCFGGGALLVPGQLGSSAALLGFSATLVAAVALYRATGVGATLTAAAITIAVFAGGSAAVRLIWDTDPAHLASGVMVAGIALLSAVPRLAALAARLPVPPVPTAGAAIDPADHEPRPTLEGIGAIGATALPSAAGLGQRADAANRYQTGMIAAAALAVVTGALGAIDPWDAPRWQQLALAVIAAVILSLRGRAFADLAQAAAMISAAALLIAGLLVGLALADPARLVLCGGLLLGFALLVVVFGVVGPHLEITPVTRRAGEIFEYLLICAIIPLVLWITGVYSMARNL